MILKKISFSLLFLVLSGLLVENTLLCSQSLDARSVKSEYLTSRDGKVIGFDLDDVISGKEKVGITAYASLIPKLIYQSPKIITAFWPSNFKAIRKEAEKIGKTTNGTSNIMHKTLEWLKAQGYGDLTIYEDEQVERSLQPFVVHSMIENIKKLKKQGYVIVAATNQDYDQYQAYNKKMKELGVDLKSLFDAVLVTRVSHKELTDKNQKSPIGKMHEGEEVYVVRDAKVYKPSADYFKALEYLVYLLVPTYREIIFTDDSLKNVEGANRAKLYGLHGIHFKLPPKKDKNGKEEEGKMRGVPESQIQNTINRWKKDMASLGVIVN